jgi:anti-sigma regulatory factor (Ser/Thr protein kinase)
MAVLLQQEAFEANYSAPRRVRAWLNQALGHLLPPTLMIDVLIVASELVTNAILHTLTPTVWVHATVRGDTLTLAVLDHGPGIGALPSPHSAAADPPPRQQQWDHVLTGDGCEWPPDSNNSSDDRQTRLGHGLVMVQRLAHTTRVINHNDRHGVSATFAPW